MRKLMTIALLALVTIGCKPASEKYAVSEVTLVPPPPMADAEANNLIGAAPRSKVGDQPGNTTFEVETSKKIIKEGEIRLETNDLIKARKALTDSLKKIGGYVEEENQNNNAGSDIKEYTFKVRIPAQNFDRFLGAVSSSADRVESKSIRVKDVTTEFIDVTTRLDNKKLLENRYKGLLAKASKMSDVLEVENKLNEIRTDIETTQGQLNYLNKQIAYSSLQVTFFTRSADAKNDGNGFGYKLKMAVSNSWDLLQNIFFGTITAWPVILISVIVIFVLRKWLRRRKARQA